MAKSKHQKKLERRNKFEKSRNISRNTQNPKYCLEVLVNGYWYHQFYLMKEVNLQNYLKEIDEVRNEGCVDILPGRIVFLKTKRVIHSIEGFSLQENNICPNMEESTEVCKTDKSVWYGMN